jgi:hypothetical protein
MKVRKGEQIRTGNKLIKNGGLGRRSEIRKGREGKQAYERKGACIRKKENIMERQKKARKK